MKKLNCKELEVVNGGAAGAKGPVGGLNTIAIYAKDGISVAMTLGDLGWLMDQYGAGFADKFTSREIMQFIAMHYTMCA